MAEENKKVEDLQKELEVWNYDRAIVLARIVSGIPIRDRRKMTGHYLDPGFTFIHHDFRISN